MINKSLSWDTYTTFLERGCLYCTEQNKILHVFFFQTIITR